MSTLRTGQRVTPVAKTHYCPKTGRGVYRPKTVHVIVRGGNVVERWACPFCRDERGNSVLHATPGIVAVTQPAATEDRHAA